MDGVCHSSMSGFGGLSESVRLNSREGSHKRGSVELRSSGLRIDPELHLVRTVARPGITPYPRPRSTPDRFRPRETAPRPGPPYPRSVLHLRKSAFICGLIVERANPQITQ